MSSSSSSESAEELMKIFKSKLKRVIEESDSSDQSDVYSSEDNDSYDDYDDKYDSDDDDGYNNASDSDESEEEIYGSRRNQQKYSKKYGVNKNKRNQLKSNSKKRPKIVAQSGIVSDESESSEDDEFDYGSGSDDSGESCSRNKQRILPVITGEVEFNEGVDDRIVDVYGDWNEAKSEVLVKWKGKSWNYSTWLTFDAPEIQAARRKLDNFLKKIEEERSVSDDGESVFLETLRFNLEENWRVVERIVAVRETRERGSFYLCKWRALGYSDCTWEWEGDVRGFGGAGLIDEFLSRQYGRNGRTNMRRSPSSFQKYTSAPDWLPSDMRLRDYQLEGVNWLLYSWCRRCNVILADEMGLGKTIQSVSFLTALKVDYGMAGPTLLVVPLSTIDAWQRELRLWARDKLNVVVYSGDAKSRQTARFYEFEAGFDVLLTTYELVLKDQEYLAAIQWKLLLVDEGHRLKNASSQLYDALFKLVPGSGGGRVLITGTPLQNSLGELWCLLRFLMPDKFSDYEGFLERYSVNMSQRAENGDHDDDDNGAIRNNNSDDQGRLTELHALIKPHILRRLKRDVEESLPGKTEKIIRVDLTSFQKQLYRCILTRNYRDLKRTQEAAGNRAVGSLINILGELKKVCNHPMLLGTGSPALSEIRSEDEANNSSYVWDESGKMVLLRRLLRRLKEDGHRVLVFSQSVKMLDLLEDLMKVEGYAWRRLDGSTTSVARHMAITAFNAPESQDFVFLLSTRAGGLGINLATADTVIIYDSDWNPQNDLQAMARAHRIGQKRTVRIFRLVSAGTVEEEILERAKRKMVLDHLVIQQLKGKSGNSDAGVKADNNATDLQAIIKFGAKSLFEADKPGIPASAVDLEAILREDDSTATTATSTSDKVDPADDDDEFLGQFRIADLGTWDEIIPETERLRIEEEEQKAAELAREVELQEALLTAAAGRRSRKQPTSARGDDKSAVSKSSGKSSAMILFPDGNEELLKAFDSLSRFGLGGSVQLISRLEEAALMENSSPFQVIPGASLQKTMISVLLERIKGLQALQGLVSNHESLNAGDLKSFRLTMLKGIKVPPSNWPIPSYSILQDSALLVTLHRFGYGSWQQIRDHLIESNGPGWSKLASPQIARRVDYLLRELQQMGQEKPGKATLGKEKLGKEKRSASISKINKRDSISYNSNTNSSRNTALDEMRIIEKFRRPFKPVRESLVALESLKSESPDSSNTVGSVVTDHLIRLGDFIDSDDRLRVDAEVWQFVGCFWPFQKASTGPELKALYESLKSRK